MNRATEWARTIFTIVLLGVLLYWIPLGDLLGAFASVRLLPIAFAFLVTTTVYGIAVFKLKIALDVQTQPQRFKDVFNAYYIGNFFNNFIPTSVGGDLVKAFQLNKLRPVSATQSVLAILVERVSGILVLAFLGLYFLVFEPSLYSTVGFGMSPEGRTWLLLLVALGLLFVPISWSVSRMNTSDAGWFEKLQRILGFPFDYPLASASVLVLSFLHHFLRGINYLLVLSAFGGSLSLLKILFILPLIAAASFLPISLGGIGLREGIITFCLQAFGLPLGISFGTSLILRGFSIVHSLTGGVLYLTNR